MDAPEAFKKELKALLTKHDVTIDFMTSGCSDWHGISDYRISAVHNKTNVETRLGDQWESYVGASDL